MAGSKFILTLHLFATLLPLVSAVAILLWGSRLRGKAAELATGAMGVSFLACLLALVAWLYGSKETSLIRIPWLPLDASAGRWLYLGALVDGLTIAMMTMVSLIAFLVHIYSMGYMEGDARFGRFFAYLSLFTFSMMGIVISNSVMQLFVFWELVGMTSYLLIGFWFEKKGPQLASKKAFVMNRVGDAGFLIGFGILFHQLGGNLLLPAAEGALIDGEAVTSLFGALKQTLAEQSKLEGLTGDAAYSVLNPPLWLTIAGIGLFFGAVGKSAQFPLQTWLPDAMEGPTPVSSIVHSATMVAAGVYMTARIYPILTPDAHLYIATIGLITLVMAACMALVMTDIKRVLAYSTLSQLGYMVLALGAGCYVYALYHLITHAFFKCCLFQCSGSVIHAAHHQQDMRHYGGLRTKMPVTAACYFVCTLAIAGASIPLIGMIHHNLGIGVSGFYSKDGIIAGAYNYGHAWGGWGKLFYWGPTLVAYLTTFYMARSFALTFLGKPRDAHLHEHAHEAPVTMLVPQLVLVVLAVISVPWLLWFWKGLIVDTNQFMIDRLMGGLPHRWVQHPVEDLGHESHAMHFTHGALLHGLGWVLALGAGVWLYKDGTARAERISRLPGLNLLSAWFRNKFYFDALYDGLLVWLGKAVAEVAKLVDIVLVDGAVRFTAWVGRLAAHLVGHPRSGLDARLVDGAVNGAADFTQSMGGILRGTQTGRIRSYVLLMFGSAALITLIVVTVAVVAP